MYSCKNELRNINVMAVLGALDFGMAYAHPSD